MNEFVIDLAGMHLRKGDLKGRDLSKLDLSGINLEGIDLSGSNLEGANLKGANLTLALLYGTNLSNVNACDAIFKDARFKDCIMRSSHMKGADFEGAAFSHSLANNSSFNFCNFKDANFYGTSLMDCFFRRANMTDANMTGCNLLNSDFGDAILNRTIFDYSNLLFATFDYNLSTQYKFGKILDEPITGYKKAIKNVSVIINGKIKRPSVPVIVTLEIPRGAIVFSINGSKCRTNKARILDIEYLVETDEYLRNLIPKTEEEYIMISEIKEQPAHSMYDHNFYYIKGDEIKINNFDMAYNLECSRGIHFFLTKKEAIDFTF